ncbi:probable chitinase 10 [Anopheles ziemanni]|uniref:probable chitinase 10 n=1 Tax=Anopheles coustani TaxID=139045 RepID=UPI00265B5AC8|nr:probable chitinase 10 [Anopheles coustani]XP_058169975.1 probable chitinase 10 [Anopheles ziemanni]
MITNSKTHAFGLLALVATIGCVAAQTTTDPCVGSDLPFLPHPTECSKYFSCYGGIGYEQVCPDGKYFDPTRSICDIAQNVDCVVNNCPPDGIVFLPIPNVCDRYTICVGGEAFEGICDENLYFDEALGDCNYKNESGCVVNPCTQPPPNPPILEIHPNESSCTQYLICLSGQPVVRDCAPGLFFDPTALQCVVADACIVSIISEERPEPLTPPELIPQQLTLQQQTL